MKDTFIMYSEWTDMIEALTDTERSELLLAIMHYQSGQDIPELSHCAKVVFAQIKMQFMKDDEKYSDTLEKRREASRMGVEARKQKQSNDNQALPHGNQVVPDSVCDSDSELKKESTLKGTRERRFTPPTVEEVKQYAAESGYAVDAERFVDYYQENGWMAGKNHMKDWKAAVRNWSRNDKERHGQTAKPNKSKTTDFQHRDYDFTELNRKLFTRGMTKEG